MSVLWSPLDSFQTRSYSTTRSLVHRTPSQYFNCIRFRRAMSRIDSLVYVYLHDRLGTVSFVVVLQNRRVIKDQKTENLALSLFRSTMACSVMQTCPSRIRLAIQRPFVDRLQSVQK